MMNKKQLLERKLEIIEELNGFMSKAEKRALSDKTMEKAKILSDELEEINNKLLGNKGESKTMAKRNYNETELKFEKSLREGNFRALGISGNGAIVPKEIADRIIAQVHELIDIKDCDIYNVKGDLAIPVDNCEIECVEIVEGTPIADSTGDFTSVVLSAKAYGKIVKIGKRLLNNADFDVLAYFEKKMAEAVARTIEHKVVDAVFDGEADMEATTMVKYDDLMGLMASMPRVGAENAKFVMNRAMFLNVAKLKDAEGHFMVQNGIVNGKMTYTLLGKAIEVSENAPANKVAFVNMNGIAVKFSNEVEITQLVEFRSSYQEALLGAVELDSKKADKQLVKILEVK